MLRSHKTLFALLLAGVLVPTGAKAGTSAPFTWDGRFAAPGVNGNVNAVLTQSDGVLFGGNFTEAGGVTAVGMAWWDGSTWSEFGGGLLAGVTTNIEVNAILKHGEDLYVGGFFTSAGGVDALNVARWDGETWHPLGAGVGSIVHDLALDGVGNLIVSGAFVTAGGQSARRVARWNGSEWDSFGDGFGASGGNSRVYDLEFLNNELYAGGSFQSSGATSVNNIARWDGVAWQPLAGGTDGAVRALVVHDGGLVMGGDFQQAGSTTVNRLARWDGAWSGVSGSGANGSVRFLRSWDGDLYVGGAFTFVGTGSFSGLAVLDAAGWAGFGTGLQGAVYGADRTLEGVIYAGGSFTVAGGRTVQSAARFDNAWSALGEGVDGPVLTIAEHPESGFYVGGEFQFAGGQAASRIARWDGAWESLGAGVAGPVYALLPVDGLVYAGGEFQNAGQIFATNIALWDGGVWNPLDTGLNGPCQDLVLDNRGRVIAAGGFSVAGGQPAGQIAVWDGISWAGLTAGVAAPFSVDVLEFYNGNLIAGGLFTEIGGVAAANIASWDGVAWNPLGTGVNGAVTALTVYNNELVVAGEFQNAGGEVTDGLAAWDGVAWRDFPSQLFPTQVSALLAYSDTLIIGGNFTLVGGLVTRGVALWDGGAWFDLGGGIEGPVTTLARVGSRLAAGGDFRRTGTTAGSNIVLGDFGEPTPIRPASFRVERRGSLAELTWTAERVSPITTFRAFREEGSVRDAVLLAVPQSEDGFRFKALDPRPPSDGARYWLEERRRNGTLAWHGPARLGPAPVPVTLRSHPNPFRFGTEITFVTRDTGPTRVLVLDASGREVARLLDGTHPAGSHRVVWDGNHQRGHRVAAGVYFVKVEQNGRENAVKLLRLP